MRQRTNPKTFSNLYKFIRLIMGNDISDRKIARQWHMNEKNFHEFKVGHYPVPKVERLVSLAQILKINTYLVFAVSIGESAEKIYNIIKQKKLLGVEKVNISKINTILSIMAQESNQCWKLFDNPNCSEAIVDLKTFRIIDCNKITGNLTGWSKEELIGKSPYFFLTSSANISIAENNVKDFFKKGTSVDIKIYDFRTKQGNIKPVLVRTTLFSINNNKYASITVWDLSKIKEGNNKSSPLIKRKKGQSLSLCLTA
jgi:PAS domain S-box-containing protein